MCAKGTPESTKKFVRPAQVDYRRASHRATISSLARGCSAVGSASPCQGEGRGFESRHPLKVQVASTPAVEWPSGEATACKAVHTGSIPVSTSNAVETLRDLPFTHLAPINAVVHVTAPSKKPTVPGCFSQPAHPWDRSAAHVADLGYPPRMSTALIFRSPEPTRADEWAAVNETYTSTKQLVCDTIVRSMRPPTRTAA